MAYPTSIDSFVNPAGTDLVSAVDHAAQHSQVNDAVEALETKLGTGSSVAASTMLLRGTGAGSSAWDKAAPAGTIVGTTDSQTLTNKTLTSATLNTPVINNPTLATDTVSEFTPAAGVNVDSLNIKDGKLNTNNSVVTANITNAAVTPPKWTNPYKFAVYRNAAANTGNGAFAKITFDTEIFDTNSNFASGTYTAPVAGYYQFNARFSVSAAHTRIIIGLYINGGAYHNGNDINTSSITNGGVMVSALVQLAANDTVDVYAFGNTALALEVGSAANTWFNGYLVSQT